MKKYMAIALNSCLNFSKHLFLSHECVLGSYNYRGRCGQDRMAVGFTTTCAISAYHYLSCEFEPRSWRGVLDTTLCDKVCQQRASGLWFSVGTLFSSTNKTDHHDITKILLKVALNTITLTLCARVLQPLPFSSNLSLQPYQEGLEIAIIT